MQRGTNSKKAIVLGEFGHSHVHWLFDTWGHKAQVSFWDATTDSILALAG